LLPETNIPNAALIADRIRTAVEACVVTYRDNPVGVTVSIGCAEYHASEGEQSHLLDRADAKMYEAKESGRNAVRW